MNAEIQAVRMNATSEQLLADWAQAQAWLASKGWTATITLHG